MVGIPARTFDVSSSTGDSPNVGRDNKYILYVYEHGQLPGLEVWGALGVKPRTLRKVCCGGWVVGGLYQV